MSRARVSNPGETFSGPCLVVLAAVYPPECRTHLASIPRGTTARYLDGLSVTHEPPMDINNDLAKIKNGDTATAAAAAAGAFTSSSQGVGPIRVQAGEKDRPPINAA